MFDPKPIQRDPENADAGFPPLHVIDPSRPVEADEELEKDYHEEGGGD